TNQIQPQQSSGSSEVPSVPGTKTSTKSAKAKTKAQPKSAPRKKVVAKKAPGSKSKAAVGPPADSPNKTVVKNGSAAEPKVQIAPSMSPQQASDQRQDTTDLLAKSDENLKKISTKSLPSDQQDMVQQIKKYMEQSKEATNAGDLERAHNLAVK